MRFGSSRVAALSLLSGATVVLGLLLTSSPGCGPTGCGTTSTTRKPTTTTSTSSTTSTTIQECGGNLEVVGFEVSPTSIKKGEPLTVKWSVRNGGPKASGGYGVEIRATSGFAPTGLADVSVTSRYGASLKSGEIAYFESTDKWLMATGAWTARPILKPANFPTICPNDKVSPNVPERPLTVN